MTISRYRLVWLGLYVGANSFAAFVFWMTGNLDGDLIDYKVPSDDVLFVATASVILSYVLWMGPLFRFCSRIDVKSLVFDRFKVARPRDWRLMSVLVFVTQLGYLVYSISYGLNFAGSKAVADSPFRHLFYFLVPDWLFIVYYGIYRKSPGFIPNLTIYLLSNVIRGWFGMWLTVLFLEGAYRVLERKFSVRKLVPILALGVLAVPFFYQLKLAIRSVEDSSYGLLDYAAKAINDVLEVGWFQAFGDAIWPIIMRFQHLANVVGIADKSSELARDAGREFVSFFWEGTPQIVIRKMAGGIEVSDIHIQLLYYLIPEQLPVDAITNTHVGLVGWFWIAPLLAGLYLIYILILSWSSIWLAKKAGGPPLLMNAVWFVWLLLLMNGWFAAYIDFLQAMVVVILARKFFSIISSRIIRTSVEKKLDGAKINSDNSQKFMGG